MRTRTLKNDATYIFVYLSYFQLETGLTGTHKSSYGRLAREGTVISKFMQVESLLTFLIKFIFLILVVSLFLFEEIILILPIISDGFFSFLLLKKQEIKIKHE